MPPGMTIPRRVARCGVPLSVAPSLLLSSMPAARFAHAHFVSSSSPFSTFNAPPSQRSLFVHVRPPPQTLAERRAVLRVIERYGHTELFKKTAANDSFICIAASTDMADKLIERSPLTYDLADSLATVPVAAAASRFAARRPRAGSAFVVSVFAAPEYGHRAAIRSGPLHGPWPDDIEPTLATSPSFKNTFMYNALRGVVPESASADALCDWRPRTVLGPSSMAADDDNDDTDDGYGDGYVDGDGEFKEPPPPPIYSHEGKMLHIRDRRARRSHATRSVLAGLVNRGR